MKTCMTIALALACSATAFAQVPSPDPDYPTMGPIERYLMPSPAAEIALARTAAPPSISAKASILVLTKTGYVTAVDGDQRLDLLSRASLRKGASMIPSFGVGEIARRSA